MGEISEWEQQRGFPAGPPTPDPGPHCLARPLRGEGDPPAALTEHTERDGCRLVAAVAAPDPALESARVLAADGGEAQRRGRALPQPPAVPVPGVEGLLRRRAPSPQAGQGDGCPFPHLRRGLDQDLCSWRRDGSPVREGRETSAANLRPFPGSVRLKLPLRQDLSSPLPRRSPWHRLLHLWWVMFPGDTGCVHSSRSPWLSATNRDKQDLS